jgi:very-short-patch-repair endonuclease
VDPIRRVPAALKVAAAHRLRRDATPAERHAWTLLRDRRLLDLKFRRQHVLHGFIVDFYCAELRLVLELDGAHHGQTAQADCDAARTAWLRNAGYRVMRIRNRDLTRDRLGKLIGRIARRTEARKARRKSPLSRQGEGDRG